MSFANEAKRVIFDKDKLGAKFCLSAAKKKMKDWKKIIDQYESLGKKEKTDFKKDPLNAAIIYDYEEIKLYLPELEKICSQL